MLMLETMLGGGYGRFQDFVGPYCAGCAIVSSAREHTAS